jgi:prepilin-type N-terminal cleavage/methylation domain-containing protein
MNAGAKGKRGFTLVEVMCTAVLIAVAVSASMGLMNWITRATGFNSRLTEATGLAHDALENLLAAGYDGVSSGSEIDGIYTIAWGTSAGSVASTGSASSKKLTAKISWKTLHGKLRDVEMDTVISEDPPFAFSGLGLQNYVVDYGGN